MLFSKMWFSSQNFSVSCSRSTKFRFVETSLYILMAAILSLVCAHRNCLKKQKSPVPRKRDEGLASLITTHSGISNNTRPGNGGEPAVPTGEFPLGSRLRRDAAHIPSHQLPPTAGSLQQGTRPPVSVTAFSLYLSGNIVAQDLGKVKAGPQVFLEFPTGAPFPTPDY